MQKENHPSQVIHVMATIFTLLLCVGLFHFVVPAQIEEKAVTLLTPLDQTAVAAKNSSDSEEISQNLLDYIQETRKDIEESDPEEEAVIEAYKKFQEEFSDKADQILTKRFKLPEIDPATTSDELVVTEGIKNMVDFWTYMFGVYNLDHVIFYNTDDVGIVYSVLDFSEISGGGGGVDGSGIKQFKSQMIGEERNRIKKMIQNVSSKIGEPDLVLTGLNPQEMRLAGLLLEAKDHIDLSEEALMGSLTFRYGFSHRIREAIVQSGLYMGEMRRIFGERGLPEELTMIPFIESTFKLKAYSKAGAAGIWQFIEATGKRYLRIDDFVDERYDPILAAYAAATHLYNEYKMLKSWPLTINAYNTGPGRMLQAIKALGTTDIGNIIKHFEGAGYGPDSRNYYPEFLAALNVYNNYEQYFADLEILPEEKFEYVVMPSDVSLKEMSRLAGIDSEDITAMNLSLRPEVVTGNKKLPKGYLLKIPADMKDNVILALQDVYREAQYATHHLVQKGESLKEISTMYDVGVQELSAINQILPKHKLNEGDIIRLPSRDDFEFSSLNNESEEQVVPDRVNTPVF